LLKRSLGKSALEKRVYVENYGCAANKYDFEIMLAFLLEAGYEVVRGAPESADFLIVNTCGVKRQTEDRVLWRLRFLSRLNKPLIVAGCLPRINLPAIKRAAPGYSAVLDPHSVDQILFAIKEAELGERNLEFFSEKPKIKANLPKVRVNKFVEIVQIAEGCTGSCAFCCTRFARGKLFSYPKEAIVDRIKAAVSGGAKEVWLTAQDTGAYGKDIGTNLAELLEEVCEVKGKFFVRVGMMNPFHVPEMLDRLIKVYKNEKVFKFLHLPLQSGDNEVLRLMNRFYSVEDFRNIVYSFRKEILRLTLATDVICGFSGESEQAFERSMELIREIKPDVLNISKFFPRPRTPAEGMEQLPLREIKERSKEMTELFRGICLERNRAWLNWDGEVIVDERGKDGSWIGRNFAYKPIAIKSRDKLLGKFLRVKVKAAFPTYLLAEIN
jgi:threonylcarbamoyladenosine tRNA methylthiotransferase CDKAL1